MHKLNLYSSEVKVNKTIGKSSQGIIYFGREISTGAKVVVKQYKED